MSDDIPLDAGSLEPEELIDLRTAIVGVADEKGERVEDVQPASLAERVRVGVRNRLGHFGDEFLDEDDSADVAIWQQEEVRRGSKGLGALWKMSLWATMTLAAYVFSTGPQILPNWIPNFTEREAIPKIYRPKDRRTPLRRTARSL